MSKIQAMFSARGRRMFASERADAEAFNAKYAGASVGPKPAFGPVQQEKVVTYRDAKSGETLTRRADESCRENAFPLILNGRPIQQLPLPQKFVTTQKHVAANMSKVKASDLKEVREKLKTKED